jgi:putrescine carbamoyltransferase
MRGLLVYFTQYQRANEPSELQKAAAKEQLEKFMADREIV